jgi:WD40 repeat protein
VRSRDGQWERPLVTARDFAGPRTATLGSLAFAPDGRTLAYQRHGAAGALIWLTPTAGGTPVQMLDDNRYFSVQDSPAWSPDSEWLAFTYSRGPSFGLGKVRVGTKEFVTVLDGLRLFSKTAWSPDGRWLAAETLDGLVRVSPDGGTPELLTSDVAFEFAWLPDSRRLAALVEAETVGHVALIEIDTDTRESRVLNPDLGPVPIANQPIRGLSFAPGQGFLTSLASARSDIWLLEGLEMPGHWMSRWFKR